MVHAIEILIRVAIVPRARRHEAEDRHEVVVEQHGQRVTAAVRRHITQRAPVEITYGSACELLEGALDAGTLGRILDAIEASGDFDTACLALRSAMRSHIFPTDGDPVALHRIVQSFDSRARRAGLHVLESWDYRAQRFADEILPVLMLDRCALSDVPADRRRDALSVLLDHYFVSILGLVAARAWKDGDPNENLDRVNHLLAVLNGGDGTSTRFVD